ncbi:hypothetical protein XELAEV_18008435mg [Xenopus laevis]|uniref:Uncharacterized protein n=1 Tax=Xenopus laevis TaxID=8355 RepID=A0A974E396_XENLA|nr:hypothetical protein XELAEV_18008435mg [Xenopus laevis]
MQCCLPYYYKGAGIVVNVAPGGPGPTRAAILRAPTHPPGPSPLQFLHKPMQQTPLVDTIGVGQGEHF